MIKVSVIVPVYNVEVYIEKCLDSLIKQTLDEIEIIVVNDGSTDGSQKIIDEFVRKSSKIKSYIKVNGGLSDARNYGLPYANGEYIGYIDSDDYVELDMYEILYNKAKEDDSDIVECNLRHTYPDVEDIEVGEKIYDKKEMLMIGRSVVWNKIYNRCWLLETKVTFHKSLIYEDVEFFLKLIPHINTYSYVDSASIHYVQRGTSLNNKFDLQTLDILEILETARAYYIEHDYYEAYYEAFEFFYARILLCSSFSRMTQIKDRNKRGIALKKNWNLLVDTFPSWRRNRYLKATRTKQGIYMRTVNGLTYRFYSVLFPLLHSVRSFIYK